MRGTIFMFSIMNVQEPSMMQKFSYLNKKGVYGKYCNRNTPNSPHSQCVVKT